MEQAIINGTLNEDFFEPYTMDVSHWLKTLLMIAYKQTGQSFKLGNEDIRGDGNRDKVSGMWVAGTRDRASGVRVSLVRDKVSGMCVAGTNQE